MSYPSTSGIAALTIAILGTANVQTSPDTPTIVGVDNFVRAEADLYTARIVADGSFMPIMPVGTPPSGFISRTKRFLTAVGGSTTSATSPRLLAAGWIIF